MMMNHERASVNQCSRMRPTTGGRSRTVRLGCPSARTSANVWACPRQNRPLPSLGLHNGAALVALEWPLKKAPHWAGWSSGHSKATISKTKSTITFIHWAGGGVPLAG